MYLNSLPARLPAPVAPAIALAAEGVFFYPCCSSSYGETDRNARRHALLLAVVAALLALAINAGLNATTMRPRPFLLLPAHVLVPRPHDTSFPSGHTAVSTAIAATLLLEGRWGSVAFLGAILMAQRGWPWECAFLPSSGEW